MIQIVDTPDFYTRKMEGLIHISIKKRINT